MTDKSNFSDEPFKLEDTITYLTENSREITLRIRRMKSRHRAPSRDIVIQLMESVRAVLFPGYYGPRDLTKETMRYFVGSTLDQIVRVTEDQILRGLCFECSKDTCDFPENACKKRAVDATRQFISRLPAIQELLGLDVAAAYEGDPAATSMDEAIYCYPGIFAVTNFRVAHELHRLKVPLIPRIITEHAHSLTGIDIHPGARIGKSFFIDHGTGVVIGETSIIGNNVRIYQGVTLGAKSFPLDENGNPIKGIDRHPVVEDNVIIYSGATILGRVTIGKDSVIGGNVWLTRDVPAGSHISQRQSRLNGFNPV